MRWIFLAIALLCSSASAQLSMTGVGGGFGGAAAFQGPGDVVSGAIAWGSCARSYNSAYANGTNPLCDLVATVGGAAVCTLRVATTGFVDLTSAYCSGAVTPATACAGGCKVTKVYDQTGSTNHFTNATLSSMPVLNFSGLNSLPSLTCSNGAGTVLASPSITQAQPFTMSAVWERTALFTTNLTFLGAQGNAISLGTNNAANQSIITAGATVGPQTANDNIYHSLTGTFDNASSGMNTDGIDTTGTAGTFTFASVARICRSNGGTSATGEVMEVGIWPSGFNVTQRGNMSTNQHGTNGYNF